MQTIYTNICLQYFILFLPFLPISNPRFKSPFQPQIQLELHLPGAANLTRYCWVCRQSGNASQCCITVLSASMVNKQWITTRNLTWDTYHRAKRSQLYFAYVRQLWFVLSIVVSRQNRNGVCYNNSKNCGQNKCYTIIFQL